MHKKEEEEQLHRNKIHKVKHHIKNKIMGKMMASGITEKLKINLKNIHTSVLTSTRRLLTENKSPENKSHVSITPLEDAGQNANKVISTDHQLNNKSDLSHASGNTLLDNTLHHRDKSVISIASGGVPLDT